MSCWVIVEPPCITRPARRLVQAARTSPRGSRPPCSKNRWSSAARMALRTTGGTSASRTGRCSSPGRSSALARTSGSREAAPMSLPLRVTRAIRSSRMSSRTSWAPAALGAPQMNLPGPARPAILARRVRGLAGLGVLEPRQRAGQVDAAHVDAGDERLGGGVHERAASRLHPPEAGQRDRGVRGERGDEDGQEGQRRRPEQAQTSARNPHHGLIMPAEQNTHNAAVLRPWSAPGMLMVRRSRRRPARVAKLADALDLGSSGRKPLGVQLPPLAPRNWQTRWT